MGRTQDPAPPRRQRRRWRDIPERLAMATTAFAGTTAASCLAMLTVVAWAVSGPVFRYSENWQLVINTGTTIVTFLMVFLIQRSQNKDALAIHLKLDEIVAALGGASNRLVTAEDLSERQLAALHRRYQVLASRMSGQDVRGAHSIDEARRRTRARAARGIRPTHARRATRRRRTKRSSSP